MADLRSLWLGYCNLLEAARLKTRISNSSMKSGGSSMKLVLSIITLLNTLLIATLAVNIAPSESQSISASNQAIIPAVITTTTDRVPAATQYRIDTAHSRFMANVGSGGVFWFLGHNHHFAVKDFSGEAAITPENIATASLQMTIRAASLEETGENFTDQQKQIINQSARKEVLEVEKYPEIVFKSTAITGEMKAGGQYEVKIKGNLTLHGVTRLIEIPAQVTVNGNILRSTGHFSIDRSDYGVKTHAIKWGTIRVRDEIKFEFDITANKV
jgi:polyisoprenoid-binding protein YceI